MHISIRLLQAIHVIDPSTLAVVKNITTDQSGSPLTNAQNKSITWNDAAFVEVRSISAWAFLKLGQELERPT
jgi:hypothetical protein